MVAETVDNTNEYERIGFVSTFAQFSSIRIAYPGLPYFMFGHSMGSMIARDFSAKYGDELAGAIYCGTTGTFKYTHEVRAKVDAAVEAGAAHESDPEFVNAFFGWMFSRCEEGASIGNEWICHDPHVQKDHAEDPFDAFTHPTHNFTCPGLRLGESTGLQSKQINRRRGAWLIIMSQARS